MALYRQAKLLGFSKSEAFLEKYDPNDVAPYAGIYRCTSCGREVAVAKGHMLPLSNHAQHEKAKGRIAWQLLVIAVSNDPITNTAPQLPSGGQESIGKLRKTDQEIA